MDFQYSCLARQNAMLGLFGWPKVVRAKPCHSLNNTQIVATPTDFVENFLELTILWKNNFWKPKKNKPAAVVEQVVRCGNMFWWVKLIRRIHSQRTALLGRCLHWRRSNWPAQYGTFKKGIILHVNAPTFIISVRNRIKNHFKHKCKKTHSNFKMLIRQHAFVWFDY